jgi:hypothetical protein
LNDYDVISRKIDRTIDLSVQDITVIVLLIDTVIYLKENKREIKMDLRDG